MKKIILLILVLLLAMFFMTACVPGDGAATTDRPANFLWGIWHGWVAPISLIISLFKSNIRVYESINTGWWYDFGFYMAIISGFGGLSLFRRQRGKTTRRD